MPEWLNDLFQSDADIVPLLAIRPETVLALSLVLGVALALGCVVAGIYRVTHGKPDNQSAGLMATLVLLTVLIAMVTLVIGNSVARAFSLVGALAIVRFRTVVEDTRDTAFVICAVAVGMAVGAGFLTVPLVGLPFVAVAAFLFRPRAGASPHGPRDCTLIVRVGAGHSPDALLREAFAKHLAWSRLQGTATARQGVALELTYAARLRHDDGALALVAELNGVDGIQNVELRQA